MTKRLRDTLIAKLGRERVQEAERRLCANCRYSESAICAPNPAMLPLTSQGDDCPYFVPSQFGAVVAHKA